MLIKTMHFLPLCLMHILQARPYHTSRSKGLREALLWRRRQNLPQRTLGATEVSLKAALQPWPRDVPTWFPWQYPPPPGVPVFIAWAPPLLPQAIASSRRGRLLSTRLNQPGAPVSRSPSAIPVFLLIPFPCAASCSGKSCIACSPHPKNQFPLGRSREALFFTFGFVIGSGPRNVVAHHSVSFRFCGPRTGTSAL